ncbi:MAG: hypothetical protein ACOYXT_27585, partial [Bacteroidota bacterium]
KNDSTSRIEIEVLNPLKAPSCAIYAVSDNKKVLLGLLTVRRTYVYDAPSNTQNLILYDKFHDSVILQKKISLSDK